MPNWKKVIVSGSAAHLASLNVAGEITGSNGNLTGYLRVAGDITAYYSSDRRLKDNIQPIESPLEKVSKLGGYSFDWIPTEGIHINEGHDIGVIAQEVEEVMPEAELAVVVVLVVVDLVEIDLVVAERRRREASARHAEERDVVVARLADDARAARAACATTSRRISVTSTAYTTKRPASSTISAADTCTRNAGG